MDSLPNTGRASWRVLRATANERPNAVALQSGTEILTYGELDKRSNQLAQYLLKNGIGAGDRIGLYLYRGTHYIIGVLGRTKNWRGLRSHSIRPGTGAYCTHPVRCPAVPYC